MLNMKIRMEIASPENFIQYYRQPHDKEVLIPGPSLRSPDRDYRGNPNGSVRGFAGLRVIPEPFRLIPDHQTPLDCGWQKLLRDMNPEHKDDVVDKILDHHWILANNTGIGEPGRKNCRNGDYMNDPTAKWPALHAVVICGGALLRGREEGDTLHIESTIIGNGVPEVNYILERPWLWFYLIQINESGICTYMTLSAKDGTRKPVRMPLLSRLPISAKLKWLEKMPKEFDPLKYDPRSFS